MKAAVEVIGVHPVEAPEPCHFLELEVDRIDGRSLVESLAQEAPGQPNENWQVPWLEHYFASNGVEKLSDIPTGGSNRLVFFMHCLDVERPLESCVGHLSLSEITPRPPRLAFLAYEAPC